MLLSEYMSDEHQQVLKTGRYIVVCYAQSGGYDVEEMKKRLIEPLRRLLDANHVHKAVVVVPIAEEFPGGERPESYLGSYPQEERFISRTAIEAFKVLRDDPIRDSIRFVSDDRSTTCDELLERGKAEVDKTATIREMVRLHGEIPVSL